MSQQRVNDDLHLGETDSYRPGVRLVVSTQNLWPADVARIGTAGAAGADLDLADTIALRDELNEIISNSGGAAS